MKGPSARDLRVVKFDEIDSTNEELKRRCDSARDPRDIDWTVVMAKSQSAGRGRLGRKFFSPAGTGLYMSMALPPKEGKNASALVTVSAAVAVCRALEKAYGVKASVKWVNDIFVRGKKVCGLLAEGATDAATGKMIRSIIGIGVNVLPRDMPEEIARAAGSVLESADNPVPLEELALSIAENILSIHSGGDEAFALAMAEYKSRSFLIGRAVTVSPIAGCERARYEALVTGVDDAARLLVRAADGTERALDSGEVTITSASVAGGASAV